MVHSEWDTFLSITKFIAYEQALLKISDRVHGRQGIYLKNLVFDDI